MERFPVDPGLVRVLEVFGVRPDQHLGHGGEAWVYALDERRVIRVLHEGADDGGGRARAELLVRLSKGAVIDVPEVLDVGEVDGRRYTIERRLAGRPVLAQLPELTPGDREALVRSYLDTAARIGDLPITSADWWGDLLEDPAVRAPSWRQFLCDKAVRSLRRAGAEFGSIDAQALADQLPSPDARSFVHLDAFPGNMLAVGTSVTAVIDFGATTAAGDRRIDPLAAAVYLTAAITPTADDRDRAVAHAWLREQELDQWFEPARRWLAAYWAFAVDDRPLHAWCRAVLLGD